VEEDVVRKDWTCQRCLRSGVERKKGCEKEGVMLGYGIIRSLLGGHRRVGGGLWWERAWIYVRGGGLVAAVLG